MNDRRISHDTQTTKCRVCGCGNLDPCFVFGVPCCWVHQADERPLCSACAAVRVTAQDPTGCNWLEAVVQNATHTDMQPRVACRAEIAARTDALLQQPLAADAR